MTLLVAEIGWNFLGNISLAKKMIKSAKKAGADAVKFQIWDPKFLKKGPWDKDGRRKIYEKAFLNEKKYNILNSEKLKLERSTFSLKIKKSLVLNLPNIYGKSLSYF